MQYAASGGRGIVFEIQQGMIDRGADIAFLSQYPHEREILFAPLTGLEVRSSHVHGSVLVVNTSLSVNLSSETIEQVIGKRMKLVQDAAKQAVPQVRSQMRASAVPELTDEVVEVVELAMEAGGVLQHEPEWYNDEANLSVAMDAAIKLPFAVTESLAPRVLKEGRDRARPPAEGEDAFCMLTVDELKALGRELVALAEQGVPLSVA